MNQIAKATPTQQLAAWFAKPNIRSRISSVLGAATNPDFFIEQVIIALTADALAECSPESKYRAAHECATLAMLPTMQHVALIPRKVKEDGRVVRVDCTVMLQWQGYHALLTRHPDVQDIRHALVHPTDEFVWDGTTQTVLRHQYDPFADDRVFRKLEDIRGGYLRLAFTDGRVKFHCVSQDTIRKARGCAQTQDVWGKWLEEQAIKTLYRNAYARRILPMDVMPREAESRILKAIEHDDETLGNDPSALPAIDQPTLPTAITDSPKSRSQAAISAMPEKTEPEDPDTSPLAAYRNAIAGAESIDDLERVQAEMQADALPKAEYELLKAMIDDRVADILDDADDSEAVSTE